MKTAIIGSRTFTDYEFLREKLQGIEGITQIISGGAMGADRLAERYAAEYGIDLVVSKPDWKAYGKAAGLRRNDVLIEKSELVIIFWDGKSPGTKYSLDLANKYKKRIKLFKLTIFP